MTYYEVNDFLEHHGVKGMRWGVRKTRNDSTKESSEVSTKDSSRKNLKRAGIILGAAVGIAAIAGGAYYAKKHFNVSMKDSANISDSAKKFAKSMAEEPLGIVHSSRGRNVGFTFPQRGGLTDPLSEHGKVNWTSSGEMFQRYGNRSEKVAARFLDPEGRLDRAGRIIPHEVMLPEALAKDVHDVDGVRKKVWPLIKDTYDALYKAEPGGV